MLHVSEKPALSDTDYTDYMLNYSGLTQDNNLYFDETGNYKKKSYDLLNTIQRNHLKVQISIINNRSLTNSKKQVKFQQLNKRWSCKFPFLAQGYSPNNNTSPLLLLCCLTLDIDQRPNT